MKSRSNTFAEQWRRKAEEQWRRSDESDLELELKFNGGFKLDLVVFWVVLGRVLRGNFDVEGKGKIREKGKIIEVERESRSFGVG
jgi:hypothetical protein